MRSGCQPSVESETWPGEERLRKLVEKTQGDMFYADTIILDLEDPYEDPQERLDLILDPSFDDGADIAYSEPFTFVHEHYRRILQAYPQRNRPLMLDGLADLIQSHMQLSLGQVIVRSGLRSTDWSMRKSSIYCFPSI